MQNLSNLSHRVSWTFFLEPLSIKQLSQHFGCSSTSARNVNVKVLLKPFGLWTLHQNHLPPMFGLVHFHIDALPWAGIPTVMIKVKANANGPWYLAITYWMEKNATKCKLMTHPIHPKHLKRPGKHFSSTAKKKTKLLVHPPIKQNRWHPFSLLCKAHRGIERVKAKRPKRNRKADVSVRVSSPSHSQHLHHPTTHVSSQSSSSFPTSLLKPLFQVDCDLIK